MNAQAFGGFDSHILRYYLARTNPQTCFAPPLRNTFAHSRNVAPVVHTSSTNKIVLGITYGVSRLSSNAPLIALNLSSRFFPTCLPVSFTLVNRFFTTSE